MTTKKLLVTLIILIIAGILVVVIRGMLVSTIPSGSGNIPVATITPTPTPINEVSTYRAKIGESVGSSIIALTPVKVLEDSRCPVGVQCIQAGTVRVNTTIAFDQAATSSNFVLTLGTPLMIGPKQITLTEVLPVRMSGVSIKTEDYAFTFEIK